MVIVRPELSKAEHQYLTFLSEEGCEYLKDYLEERINGGEKLTPDSPIIRPKVAPKPFIRTVNVGDMIKETIRSAGFTWRPYDGSGISHCNVQLELVVLCNWRRNAGGDNVILPNSS